MHMIAISSLCLLILYVVFVTDLLELMVCLVLANNSIEVLLPGIFIKTWQSHAFGVEIWLALEYIAN